MFSLPPLAPFRITSLRSLHWRLRVLLLLLLLLLCLPLLLVFSLRSPFFFFFVAHRLPTLSLLPRPHI
jgi:hypothetical protein